METPSGTSYRLLKRALPLQVIFARDYLKTTRIGEKQVKYIVEQARRGKVQGHRAELFAVSAGFRPWDDTVVYISARLN